MSNVEILSGALVLAGLYISYQMYVIARYKRLLTLATYAMQGLLSDLYNVEVKVSEDEEDTDE